MFQKISTQFPKINKKILVLSFLSLGVLLILILLAISLFSGPKFEEEEAFVIPEEEAFVPDQVIVEFVSEDARLQISARLSELGVVRQEKVFDSNDPILSNFYTLVLQEGTNLDEFERQITPFPEIKSAEKNDIIYTQVVPNDPQYSSMYGLSKIEAANAWDLTTGSDTIVVAVIDTGIDYNHQDFAGRNIIRGKDFSTCDHVSGGACVAPKPRDDDPFDDSGHGTHVAGTIGASTNNGIGVAGVNWNVALMAVKVFGAGGSGSMTDVVEGIRYAADNGAQVINMSLGGGGGCSSLHQSAIDYALSKGIVVAVAAGNSSADASNYTPASCAGIITVGSTTSSDSRSSFSNYGATVDVAAPGSSILSTIPGGYKVLNGTSMATPHVAGVAALLLAANPGISPQQVKDCIVQNADPIVTDRPIGPRLNAFKTISNCSSITPSNPTPTTGGPTPTGQPGVYKITGSVILDTNNNGLVDGTDTPYQNATLSLAGTAGGSQVTGADGLFEFLNLQSGTYTLTLNILSGNKSTSFTLGPDKTVDFLVGALSAGEPTIVPNPTNNPVPTQSTSQPTSAPILNPSITISPTPVPYTCYVDPQCLSEGQNIHLCKLICAPQR